MQSIQRLLSLAVLALAAITPSHAAMGLSQIDGTADDGPITLYYPTESPSRTVMRGPFALQVAEQATPARGNGRLIVLSHGSGGSPWVHHDLARSLVEAGFVVALPQHRGDNHLDYSGAGPDSWARRPAEVSRTIDALGRDARFAPLLALDRVGVWGGSAGGHTALSLAGGSWSPARFQRHCDAHLDEDFPGCAGLFTRLTGGWADGLKRWAVRSVLRWKFDDAAPKTHDDPRIAAVVAMVPLASDFDPASLAKPRVPLALVTARQDRWLPPRWHSDRVLQACLSCTHLADLPTAGHGAMLSPLPPGMTGLVGDLLNDPPGFDRKALPAVDRQVAAFFARHLPAPQGAGQP